MTESQNSILKTATGVMLMLALWELTGRMGWFGRAFPPLTEIVLAFETETSRRVFARSLAATLYSSVVAFLIGAAVALALALITAVAPNSEKGLDTLASVLYAVPIISFGPVLILVAGRSNTPIVLGALSTYFPIYVALTSALRFAPPIYDDLAGTLGASRAQAFFRLRLPHSVPAFVDGLRLAAPVTVLGVILGEWFGASRGLGVLIISALQNFRISQLWASAVLCIVCTFGAYIILTVLHRLAAQRFSW
jgi:NitT/TauT family transport system permease protein